ncbi:MAG: 23S rRNA (uracil(1939)-C(5))-methyltransferase RlmD [Planctomycetota bacterium]
MPHRRHSSTRHREDPGEQVFSCRHFGICGGCSLLDQPVAWQLHDKVEAAEALLAPFLDGQRVAWSPPERPQRHFRTRLLYPVRQGHDHQPIVGIYEYRSHHVVRIEECQTQDEWLTALGQCAERVMGELRLQPYVATRRRGQVKAFWARLASGTGEVLAGIVTRPGEFDEGKQFADALIDAAMELRSNGRGRRLVGVMHSISDRDDEFMLGDRHMPLRGRDHVLDERDGLTFRVSAGSFYQIHAGAHALLYRPTIEMCGDVRDKHVVDGYGGVGAFGLRLAKAGAREVLIVEDNAAACRDAEHNAKENGLTNVVVRREAFGGATLPRDPDLMLVDPPRAGLQQKGVNRVLRSNPKRLVYVACAADALQRDLPLLRDSGYRVTAARLCDLFPHTEHVELVVRLDRD